MSEPNNNPYQPACEVTAPVLRPVHWQNRWAVVLWTCLGAAIIMGLMVAVFLRMGEGPILLFLPGILIVGCLVILRAVYPLVSIGKLGSTLMVLLISGCCYVLFFPVCVVSTIPVMSIADPKETVGIAIGCGIAVFVASLIAAVWFTSWLMRRSRQQFPHFETARDGDVNDPFAD